MVVTKSAVASTVVLAPLERRDGFSSLKKSLSRRSDDSLRGFFFRVWEAWGCVGECT
jgi:hypothetical protein